MPTECECSEGDSCYGHTHVYWDGYWFTDDGNGEYGRPSDTLPTGQIKIEGKIFIFESETYGVPWNSYYGPGERSLPYEPNIGSFADGPGWYYWGYNETYEAAGYLKCNHIQNTANDESIGESENTSKHIHNFVTGIIYEATQNSDGLEGTYCKNCGFIKESSPISAFGFTLEKYAQQKIDAAKSGQTIVLELGELNSFPKSFMEMIAAKVAAGVSFEFRYMWNHELQKVKIPAGTVVDTNLDWYGPATIQQLYGAN